MSFATDLRTLMTSDASINAEIDGGIYYENLPDNFDLSKKWILYFFRIEDQVNCMKGKNIYQTADLSILVITQNTTDLLDLSDLIVDYLNGKDQGTTILDVNFLGDGHSFDQEKNVYTNTLSFNVIRT